MIRSKDGSRLTFPAAPSDSPPLKLLALVGSDAPQGDAPFGHSAVEPYRVINPLIGASRYGITSIAVKVHLLRASEEAALWDWADVILYVRAWPLNPTVFTETIEKARKAGKRLILDLDDWWELPDGHPSKPFFDAVVVPFVATYLPAFDRVICATEALAAKVRPLNPRVVVVPNTINPTDWIVKTPRRVPGLTVGWQGGGTHYEDTKILADVWPAIAQAFPAVRFVVAGYLPDFLRARLPTGRLYGLPYVPLAEFPASVAEIDIACCPLLDSAWARCKSPIKWMESAILGKAVVASDIVYGETIESQETGITVPDQFSLETGRVAPCADYWIDAIATLIEKPWRRERIGVKARASVIDHFSVDELGWDWATAYRGE